MSVSVFCPHCHRYTALSMAPAKHETDFGGTATTAALWDAGCEHKWWIGVCNNCQTPSLVLNKGDVVYPHPLPTPTDENIPMELASDLDEAKMCFAVGCHRACAVMARRCIQMACIMKGAKKTNLVEQIRKLTASGAITKDIEEWATVVRWVGNDAAHPGRDPVTKEDAEDCLKLAEQFLHVIFVAPAIANARREKRGK